MRIVVAPDSFKGSLSAREAANAIGDGWSSVRPNDEVIIVPLADGGEGTLDAIEGAISGAQRHVVSDVTGPDGRLVEGYWLELPGKIGVAELALVSGLTLMPQLDPFGSTTRGLGEVIRAAVLAGMHSLVVGLGGSASTDGGSGALVALGAILTDAEDRSLSDGGGFLVSLSNADFSQLIKAPQGGVTLLTDVESPLLGPNGAAVIFGPQKGANPADVIALERSLKQFATILGGRPDDKGAGAAGGTGYGLASAWNAVIVSGSSYIQDLTGLDRKIRSADLVISGEGQFDNQSLLGKVVGRVFTSAKSADVPVAIIAGQLQQQPASWSASLTELAGSVEDAKSDPRRWLKLAGSLAAAELGR